MATSSPRQRFFPWFLRVPLITLTVVFLCSTLYLVDFIKQVGTKHDHVCLKAHGIVRSAEVYRIFTHVFFHKGPWHLAVTMIPTLILGTAIERQEGSILMLFIIIIFWIISTLLEVAMATILYHIAHKLFHGCSLGFSGIEFGLLVLVTKFIKFQECGFSIFRIPCSVLPWACLVLYYVGFHRGSIFMHVGGIIAGYAYKYGVLNCILPSPAKLAEWEDKPLLSYLVHVPCFVLYTRPGLPLRNPVVLKREQFLHVVYTRTPPTDLEQSANESQDIQ